MMQGGFRTVFDAGAIVFDPLIPSLFPLAALAFAAWLFKTSEKRLYWKLALGLSAALVVLVLVLPWLDHRRVRDRVATGAVESAEGVVSGHRRWSERRFDGTSKGVGVTSTSRYTTTTYETFYVGDRFFSYIVGGDPSGASFTNSAEPPVRIEDGMLARATYFADDWNDDRLRIVRLELGRPPPDGAVAAVTQTVRRDDLHPEFANILSRLSSTVIKRDATALRTMVEFPFRFGGHTLEANEFDTLSTSLFTGPLGQCLALGTVTHMAFKVGQEHYSLSCRPYTYRFVRTPTGWKLTEFGADGEAT